MRIPGFLLVLSFAATGCDFRDKIPLFCGTDPQNQGPPPTVSLTEITEFSACARDPQSSIMEPTCMRPNPKVLEIPSPGSGQILFHGKARHTGKDPTYAPSMCGVALAHGYTPIGLAVGSPNYPANRWFRFEGNAVIRCSEFGLMTRLDDNKNFVREDDVRVQLVLHKGGDPRIGPLTEAIKVRCLGGDGNPPVEQANKTPTCGCSTSPGHPQVFDMGLIVLATFLVRRHSRRVRRRG